MVKKKNQTYIPLEIQSETLKDMSVFLLRDVVLQAIKCSDYHSIMVDDSSDVSNKEPAVFFVRWVDEDLISHEDFIGLIKSKKLMPQISSLGLWISFCDLVYTEITRLVLR